jgi:hypothetical protein
MIELAHYPLPAIFVVSVVLIVAAGELGHWLGRRTTGHGGENVATLKAAILGLLALMIGFTFAMAQTRFELRRDSVLNEASSIGTTALRARLLPPPHNTESLALLRDYVNVRLEITQRIPSPSEFKAAIGRSNAILEALWQQAKLAATKNDAMVPTGLFIQALNQMIDSHSKRLAAARSRVPGWSFIRRTGRSCWAHLLMISIALAASSFPAKSPLLAALALLLFITNGSFIIGP